jgi:hypothetical protein
MRRTLLVLRVCVPGVALAALAVYGCNTVLDIEPPILRGPDAGAGGQTTTTMTTTMGTGGASCEARPDAGGDASGHTILAETFGNPGVTFTAEALAVDQGDNLYLGGTLVGSIDMSTLDLGGHLATGNNASYVARLDPCARGVWASSFETQSIYAPTVHSLAVDLASHVAFTGKVSGPTSFGGPPLDASVGQSVLLGVLNQTSGFLAAPGALLGEGMSFNNPYWQPNLAANPKAGVMYLWLVGMGGFIHFGSKGFVTAANDMQNTAFLASFDPATATFLFAEAFNGPTRTPPAFLYASAVAADTMGNVFVAGKRDDGNYPLNCSSPSPTDNSFVAELDTAGNCLWLRGEGFGGISALAIDPSSGDLLVAGSIVGSQGVDVLVSRLDTTGKETLPTTIFGTATSNQSASGVAVNAKGEIFVTGRFAGTLDFGLPNPPVATHAKPQDIFLVKLDPQGKPVWARSFSNETTDLSLSLAPHVAVDSTGTVILAGTFATSITIDTQRTAKGSTDVYVIKLAP